MPVAHARRKARAVASDQHFLAVVGHQHQFARQHVDELVLVRVPVPLARPGARGESNEVHAEVRQSGRDSKPVPAAAATGFIER